MERQLQIHSCAQLSGDNVWCGRTLVRTQTRARRRAAASDPRASGLGRASPAFGWEPEVRGNPGRGRGGEIPLITLSHKSSPPEVPSHILNPLRQFNGSKAS